MRSRATRTLDFKHRDDSLPMISESSEKTMWTRESSLACVVEARLTSRGRGRRAVSRRCRPRARRPHARRLYEGRKQKRQRKERKRSKRSGLRDAGWRRRQHAKRANEHARRLVPTLVTLKIRLLLVPPFFLATSEPRRPLRSVRFF